jgi:hypothetical protein
LVEDLAGNACRITVDMVPPWSFKPSQHVYLYIPSIKLWTSCPFSVAWSEEAANLIDEGLAMNHKDLLSMKNTNMSFIVRTRTRFTNIRFKKGTTSPNRRFLTKCFAEDHTVVCI